MKRLPLANLACALILLVALGVRLLTFQRALPFVDYPDEANMFLLAVDWRGDFPLADEYGAHLTGTRLAGYPPLYPWVAIGMQHVVEGISTESFLFAGDYVYGLRLLAVIAGVLTVAALWVMGWALGGPVAAALAAIIWAVAPVVVAWNSLAIPDPLVYLVSAWSLAFALWAWHKDAPIWTLASLICAIAAIYLKYTPLHVLVAWGGGVLLMLARDWRRMLPWFIAELGIGALSAGWLVFGYGALQLQNDEAMRVDLTMAFDLMRGLHNLYGTLLPVGVGLFVVGGLAGLVAAYRQRGHGVLRRVAVSSGYLLAVIVIGVLSVSTFIGIQPYTNQMRHVLPVAPAAIGLWAMLCALAITAVRGLNRRYAYAVLALLIGGFSAVALWDDWALIRRFEAPDARYQLWLWSDASLPTDGAIMMHPESRLRYVWNRPYSGYDGQTAFRWVFDADPTHSSAQQLAQQGVAWLVMTRADYLDTAMQTYLQDLTLVQTIQSSVPEQDILVYRLLPPQFPAQALFGDTIQLIGYDLAVTEDTVYFRPYWQTSQPPPVNYSLFVHVLGAEDAAPRAQYDGHPAQPARPASTWTQPDELLIGADVQLALPDTAATHLRVGLYDYQTGQRLLLPDGQDFYDIPLTVP